MKNRGGLKQEKGFTLVEVLVAMAIFSAVLFTLFSSFDAFLATSQMIRDRQSPGLGAGTGLKVMESDLEQIFVIQPPQYRKPDQIPDSDKKDRFQFLAQNTSTEGKDFSTLKFTSLTPVQFKNFLPDQALDQTALGSGITRITYYVHAHGERLDLHRADRPVFLTDSDMEINPCTDPVLFMDIQTFDLKFIDAKGDEHSVWDSEDEDFGYGLPVLVTIRMGLNQDSGKNIIETTLSLPIARQVDK